ncbi:uncharacterized protein LOC126681821 [Mercurialis annua]|uniref:uncharacterized protein LOC126681821 n=1 Tax=Mercurialis annua TaxID=3986 RepID=UPI0024ADB958|nr:uncharacterized protein LOC126681821 [Mercurialis annua]
MTETKKASGGFQSSGQQGGSSSYQHKPSQYKSQKGGVRKGYQPCSHSSGYNGSSRGSGRGYNGTSSVPFCQNCRRRHSRQCTVAPGSCYACGQQGHFARECPSSRQQMSSASVAQPFFQQQRPVFAPSAGRKEPYKARRRRPKNQSKERIKNTKIKRTHPEETIGEMVQGLKDEMSQKTTNETALEAKIKTTEMTQGPKDKIFQKEWKKSP